MLIPFDRNLAYIEEIKGKYIPSFINDHLRFDPKSSGYFLAVSGNNVGYIFFDEGKIIGSLALLISEKNELPNAFNFSSFSDYSKVDIYTNLTESSTAHDLNRFMNSFYSLYGSYDFVDVEKYISNIEANHISGTLGFMHGIALNTAKYEKGHFVSFSYYHPDTKSYALEKKQVVYQNYLKQIRELKPFIMMKTESHFKENLSMIELYFFQKDVVVTLLLCYFDIFNLIVETMLDKGFQENVIDMVNHIIKELREKYPPLYRKMRFSDERKCVNWEEILNDRKYISLKYRFEHYYLYMDELLGLLLKVMFTYTGREGVERFKRKIKLYTEKYDFNEDREIKKLFYRIEKMYNV